jgi:hypothetical protein
MITNGNTGCPCGSLDFDEMTVSFDVTVPKHESWGLGRQVAKMKAGRKEYWARSCQACYQITFWSKPSAKRA